MNAFETNSATQQEPTRYMARTRAYYRALGYTKDYVWSTYDDVPFVPFAKLLKETTVALLTTASPPGMSNRDEAGRKHVWFGEVAAPPAQYVTEVAWDRECTHTDDPETFLPIKAAGALADEGAFVALTDSFVGIPTKYRQRETIEVDAPIILERLQRDRADAAILTAL